MHVILYWLYSSVLISSLVYSLLIEKSMEWKNKIFSPKAKSEVYLWVTNLPKIERDFALSTRDLSDAF